MGFGIKQPHSAFQCQYMQNNDYPDRYLLRSNKYGHNHKISREWNKLTEFFTCWFQKRNITYYEPECLFHLKAIWKQGNNDSLAISKDTNLVKKGNAGKHPMPPSGHKATASDGSLTWDHLIPNPPSLPPDHDRNYGYRAQRCLQPLTCISAVYDNFFTQNCVQ